MANELKLDLRGLGGGNAQGSLNAAAKLFQNAFTGAGNVIQESFDDRVQNVTDQTLNNILSRGSLGETNKQSKEEFLANLNPHLNRDKMLKAFDTQRADVEGTAKQDFLGNLGQADEFSDTQGASGLVQQLNALRAQGMDVSDLNKAMGSRLSTMLGNQIGTAKDSTEVANIMKQAQQLSAVTGIDLSKLINTGNIQSDRFAQQDINTRASALATGSPEAARQSFAAGQTLEDFKAAIAPNMQGMSPTQINAINANLEQAYTDAQSGFTDVHGQDINPVKAQLAAYETSGAAFGDKLGAGNYDAPFDYSAESLKNLAPALSGINDDEGELDNAYKMFAQFSNAHPEARLTNRMVVQLLGSVDTKGLASLMSDTNLLKEAVDALNGEAYQLTDLQKQKQQEASTRFKTDYAGKVAKERKVIEGLEKDLRKLYLSPEKNKLEIEGTKASLNAAKETMTTPSKYLESYSKADREILLGLSGSQKDAKATVAKIIKDAKKKNTKGDTPVLSNTGVAGYTPQVGQVAPIPEGVTLGNFNSVLDKLDQNPLFQPNPNKANAMMNWKYRE